MVIANRHPLDDYIVTNVTNMAGLPMHLSDLAELISFYRDVSGEDQKDIVMNYDIAAVVDGWMDSTKERTFPSGRMATFVDEIRFGENDPPFKVRVSKDVSPGTIYIVPSDEVGSVDLLRLIQDRISENLMVRIYNIGLESDKE
jgi:hypothetical protein